MEGEDEMKRKILVLTAAALAGMLLLTACTSSEDAGKQAQVQGNQGGAAGTDGSGTVTGTAANNTDNQSGQGAMQGQDVSGVQDVSGTAVSGAQGTSGDAVGGIIPQGEPVEDGGPVGEVIPDEYADAQEEEAEDGEPSAEDADDIWSGVYIGDEETVTVALLNKESLSFSFEEAGISGTAAIKGHQAVYNGDDHHVVVFNVNNDMLDVSVSSEEDFDASGSPLIGTYIREDELS